MLRNRVLMTVLISIAISMTACASTCGNMPPAASQTPTPTPIPAESSAPTLATCPEERPQACTFDYRPVCATVDTGVRCVTTPCPSTEQKTYGNACSACADEKVIGHVPGECATTPTSN